MGQKTVRFSDLSGQLIMHDDALARIVVHEHPELGDGPVEIEALTEEAEAMEEAALRVAVIDLRYWWYAADGSLYAPKGGENLSPRQQPSPSRYSSSPICWW